MAQLSRPFQIALVAVALFAAVWLFALHGRPSSTSGSGSSAAVPSSASPATAAAEERAAAAPSPVYHGSAPGVSGLTRAIAKAHEAVAASQQNAKQLEQKSAQASSTTAPAASASTTASPASSSAASHASPAHAPATSKTSTTTTAPAVHKGASAPVTASRSTLPSGQRAVEAELKQGKIVVLLFWNSKGADDVVVHKELQLLVNLHHSASRAKQIAVHETSGGDVASFGSITRGVQVYGTPTILIVNRKGQTITLTGLTDAYSIEQAIDEARHS